jgi:hypothetical protein
MVIPINKKYESEFDLYYALIALYNVIEKWGLTETQMNILVYLIRFGYSKDTKGVICEKLGISDKSLTTNLSYLRQGKVGKKKIKKLLKTSQNNHNITLLSTELNDIKKLIDSKDETKSFIVDFGGSTFLGKLKEDSDSVKKYILSLKKEIADLKNDTTKKTTADN